MLGSKFGNPEEIKKMKHFVEQAKLEELIKENGKRYTIDFEYMVSETKQARVTIAAVDEESATARAWEDLCKSEEGKELDMVNSEIYAEQEITKLQKDVNTLDMFAR